MTGFQAKNGASAEERLTEHPNGSAEDPVF